MIAIDIYIKIIWRSVSVHLTSIAWMLFLHWDGHKAKFNVYNGDKKQLF